MDHHHTAALIAALAGAWVSFFASMVGVVIAIYAGIRYAKHPEARPFDFAASARRIRTMPIAARDDA